MIPRSLLGPEIPAAAYQLYGLLACYADSDHHAFPGVNTLAAKLGLAPRSVSRTMRLLEAAKYLRVTPRYRPNGSQTSNDYYLTSPAQEAKEVPRRGGVTAVSSPYKGVTAVSSLKGVTAVSPPELEDELDKETDLARIPPRAPVGPQLVLSGETPPDAKGRPYEREFEAVWRDYPRKLAKQNAYRAFVARLRSGAPLEELVRATRHYAEARAGEDPTYTLHGATFFGPSQRWRDYVDGVPEVPAGKRNPLAGRHRETLAELAASVALQRRPLESSGASALAERAAPYALPLASSGGRRA
jgi:hypothetical protein